MRICLERIKDNGSQTTGKLFIYNDDGGLIQVFPTLELPWLNNQKRISCIPIGTYQAIKHNSPKFGESFWVLNVPDRSEILIHKGNYNYNTLGCILPGLSVADINGDGLPDVTQSAKAMKRLYEILPDEFQIEITENDN